MAADFGERTEPASPRRRQEARSRGQVARSLDLVAAVLLLVGFIALDVWGVSIWQGMQGMMRSGLSMAVPWDLNDGLTFAAAAGADVFKRLLPFLITLMVAAAIALFAQVGPLLTLKPISPNFTKLNPISGLQRLLSGGSAVTLLMNLAKLGLVIGVVYAVVGGRVASIIYSGSLNCIDLLVFGAQFTFRLGVTLAALFVLLAILDYVWQRYRNERSLRMTKEEVKDELRSMEGDPAIKRRRRQLQLQLVAQRLKKDVPKADVVITNPTHVSVAVAYDGDTMPAPKVIAKGADEMALRIREIARGAGVPIVERKPLARALFESVEVNQYIPERFYQAIAEILAYVYELTGRLPRENRGPAKDVPQAAGVALGAEQ